MREDESKLRQENLQLKVWQNIWNIIHFKSILIFNLLSLFFFQEQILRLRMTADTERDVISAPYQNPYSPPQLSQQQLSMKLIAAAIAMAIFGLILGKFVL